MARRNPSKPKHRSRVTVREVADDVGVSIATVSYVLNDRGSVSDEVRRKVRRAAAKLGYRQNRAARAMKIGRTDIIGLIIPNIENPFFATLVQSVLQEAQRRDHQVFVVDTEGSHESEIKAMRGLVAQGVDGIIVFPIDDSDLDPIRALDVPVVVLDRENPNLDLIQAEYRNGGRMIAEHLLELGHRRFGLLEGPQVVTSGRERSRGFIDTLNEECVVAWRLEERFAIELSADARAILQRPDVTAIVCGNDQIAMAAVAYLQRCGSRVPEDVSVVGFDDIPFASLTSPTLTTVRMPTAAMGVEAVNLLLKRLRPDVPTEARNRIVLGVELMKRGSTGSAPTG
ncbi:MAG: LacI family DNA-binding transcriptional regulator [Rhodospirillaceae bacterium]|nr:LacI family DNA-binding transcriptional regulator [Rhodospirillaceae bacterium]MDD9999248.1 LacI family DNA-binding transcriptional regulator [Rhodospirillaceae bacterium]